MTIIANRKFGQRRKAFTLPEVIIAIGILVTVVIASTNLLVSIIRSNNENVHTLVAYGLAQEGLEGMRNIRDSDWLLGADFKGNISTNKIWNDALPDIDSTAYFTLDFGYLNNEQGNTNAIKSSEISSYAPWKLTKITEDGNGVFLNPEASKLLMHKDTNSQIHYVHSGQADDQKSVFSRYLKVEAMGYDSETQKDHSRAYKYRITSVVSWTELNREKEIRLTGELTDWKGGPL